MGEGDASAKAAEGEGLAAAARVAGDGGTKMPEAELVDDSGAGDDVAEVVEETVDAVLLTGALTLTLRVVGADAGSLGLRSLAGDGSTGASPLASGCTVGAGLEPAAMGLLANEPFRDGGRELLAERVASLSPPAPGTSSESSTMPSEIRSFEESNSVGMVR
jgi:hypothetical protein